MQQIKDALNSHILSAIVVAIVAVGAVKSILGDITYAEYVETVTVLVGLTAVGRGLAAYKG